jgi:hypothetical protein
MVSKLNLKHWPIYRILRLVVAIGCFYTFYLDREWFILFIGAIALYQTAINYGCSSESCDV